MIDVVSNFNKNNVVFTQARKMHSFPIKKNLREVERRK